METVLVAGAGPAGAAAAIAACREGSRVHIIDRATQVRHKVCGEFLSPLTAHVLEELGAANQFRALGPCPIRRSVLHLGRYQKSWRLPEVAWGLSRLRLDGLLVDTAVRNGATICRGEALASFRHEAPASRLVLSFGRRPPPPAAGQRLFGFKSHFEGPCNDAVELFVDRFGYAGVSGIEDGLTNVCGLAPESFLRKFDFDFDAVVNWPRALAERLRPLRRQMKWVVTGPLSFSSPAGAVCQDGVYPAGDALGFVDPFSGTGILNALVTGRLAGIAAARGVPTSEHVQRCRELLDKRFLVSSVLRHLMGFSKLYWLAPCLPGRILFRWTRISGLSYAGKGS